MSVNYAQGLSDYPNKGVCGLPEISEPRDQIESKVQQLIRWIKESQKTVFFVGAGISTVCGIPDFRGPCGVWTMQQKHENARNKRMKTKEDAGLDAEKKSKIARIHEESKMEDGRKREDVSVNQLKDPLDAKTLHPLNEAIDKCEMINFNQAKPSYTHLGITEMVNRNLIQLVVSQNVDGLFLRTGLARKHLCEMHGNFYLDECSYCLARFVRCEPSPTMGLKLSSVKCARGGRPCRGMLRDTILDWEDELPAFELDCAEKHCKSADLCVCLGTSLQIFPVADLPFMCRRRRTKTKGKVVIINLQATPASKKADMVIHAKTDLVMKMILERLDIQCPSYTTDKDLILLRNECTDHLIY